MAEEKKSDFVVSDRRRFAPEGDRRSDAPVAEEEASTLPPAASKPPAQPPQATMSAPPPQPPLQTEASPSTPPPAEMPAPPTAEEQREQSEAYKASGKKLEDIFGKPEGSKGPMEMTFERVIESFYMSALIQLGALRAEGEPPSVDLIGARQTIDSLSVLQEKTKGNLTDREQLLMQNVLFELRMAWIEMTNAIASAPPPGSQPGAPGPGAGLKK